LRLLLFALVGPVDKLVSFTCVNQCRARVDDALQLILHWIHLVALSFYSPVATDRNWRKRKSKFTTLHSHLARVDGPVIDRVALQVGGRLVGDSTSISRVKRLECEATTPLLL